MATIENIIALRDEATPTLKRITEASFELTDSTEHLTQKMNTAAKATERLFNESINTDKLTASTDEATEAFERMERKAKSLDWEVRLAMSANRGVNAMRRMSERASQSIRNIGGTAHATGEKIRGYFRRSFRYIQEDAERMKDSVNGLFRQIVGGNLVAMGIMKVVDTAKEAINAFFETSNHVASLNGRLDVLTNNAQASSYYMQEMYKSAQNARGDFLAMADAAVKIHMNASETFKDMNDAIKFTEQMQKVFKIGGSTAEEQRAAMLQLSQALASGRLQGDEFRSISEAAPQVLDYVAKAMNVSRSQVKKLASEGKITAEIMKKAMLDNTDEINAKFKTIPLTWGDITTKLKNTAIEAFKPIMKAVNDLANNPAVIGAIDALGDAFKSMAPYIAVLIRGIGQAFSFVSQCIEFAREKLNHYKNILNILKAVMIPLATVVGVFATAIIISSTASAIARGATLAWTAAQWLLNAALDACPIVWIIASIFGVVSAIVAVIYWMTNAGDKANTVAGSIAYVFGLCWGYVHNAAAYCWNGILDMLAGALRGVRSFAGTAANIFIDMWNAIKSACVEGVNFILSKLSAIPGFKEAFNISPVAFSATPHVSLHSYGADAIESHKIDYINPEETGRNWGKATDAFIQGDATAKDYKPPIVHGGSPTDDGGNQQGGKGGSHGGDSHAQKQTAKNTKDIKDGINATNEQLKLMRSVAEREAINKFTQGNIKIDLGGINVSTDDKRNVDGLLVQLKEVLTDAVKTGTERVCM